MVKRLMLIAAIFGPSVPPAVAGPHGTRRMTAGAEARNLSRKALEFRIAVEPLLDAEWWAAAAVKCQLRTPDWLHAVETTIDHQASVAARLLWGKRPGSVSDSLRAFIASRKRFRIGGMEAAPAACMALLSDGTLEQLDGMAAAESQRSGSAIRAEFPRKNASG